MTILKIGVPKNLEKLYFQRDIFKLLLKPKAYQVSQYLNLKRVEMIKNHFEMNLIMIASKLIIINSAHGLLLVSMTAMLSRFLPFAWEAGFFPDDWRTKLFCLKIVITILSILLQFGSILAIILKYKLFKIKIFCLMQPQ